MHNPKNKECEMNLCKIVLSHPHTGECGICTCPTEQKEEWDISYKRKFHHTGIYPNFKGTSLDDDIQCFIRTQLALAEERGRDAQQKEDYEVAKAQQEKAFKSGTELGEERGRREGYANRRDDRYEDGKKETITAFVEWAKKYQIFTSTCGHTGDEEKGYQKGLTAGESLFQSELLAFADSLESNLTQKS